MKQRITVEQLNELTEEQKARLREWWQPEKFDLALANYLGKSNVIALEKIYGEKWIDIEKAQDDFGEEYAKKDMTPLLSIGQCIALLNDKKAFVSNAMLTTPPVATWGTVWHEDTFTCQGYVAIDWKPEEIPELIDAFWEAVKAVL